MAYSLLIKNCGQILTMKGSAPKSGKAMSNLGIVLNGFVACQGDRIVEVGVMKQLKQDQVSGKTRVIDVGGKVVMPGLIDCHTHLVFAGSRENEFKMKLEGKSYLEILKAGGGILRTVKETRKASKAELVKRGFKHLEDMLKYGITTVEVKSGYGLDLKTEMKILDVVRELSKKSRQEVVPTFLGAHTVPSEYKGRDEEYLDFLIDKVLPKVKSKAEFVDVFCEKGAFNLKQSKKYLEAAKGMGFELKIHSEQINRLGGAKMAAELGAVSCDHLDRVSGRDIRSLAKSGIVGVLLPIVPLYLREEKYADAREMIDAGLSVAVSTDFNPGSSPTKNIYLAMSLACLKMGMRIEEVLTAVTINAACALKRGHEIGSLEKGKRADIVVMDVSDYKEIPYWVGDSKVEKVIVRGV